MSSMHFLICSGSACKNDLSSTVFHLRVLTPTTQLTVKTVSSVHTEMACQCYLESSRGNSNYVCDMIRHKNRRSIVITSKQIVVYFVEQAQ